MSVVKVNPAVVEGDSNRCRCAARQRRGAREPDHRSASQGHRLTATDCDKSDLRSRIVSQCSSQLAPHMVPRLRVPERAAADCVRQSAATPLATVESGDRARSADGSEIAGYVDIGR
jgi:hypothetical protein